MAAYDVIVVGLGGMGSACCWQLAKRGLRVLGLDAHPLGHTLGSSHGINRIIRKPYYENPAYVPLVLRAYDLWRELEAASGEQILHVTGGLDAGAPGSKTFLGAVEACRLHDLPHEILDGADLGRRFPAFQLPRDFMAVVCPDSGFVLSELAIATHLSLAAHLGAELRRPEPVLGWEARGDRVTVTTGQGTYEAPQLVLAAGAWMADLVPRLRGLAVPERQVIGWFAPQSPELFDIGRFPVFTMNMPEGEFYGFPSFGIPGLKIGRHRHQHEATTPQAVDRVVHEADEAMLRAAVRRYLPQADGPLVQAATCLYTNTPDEDFIIDRLPGQDNVLLLSPCSGHGYKFCSVVGEIAADLVSQGCTKLDTGFLALDRFAPT